MSIAETVPWIKKHIELYKSDPEGAHYYAVPGSDKKLPSLMLTTIGHKSGERRAIPLFYGKVGDDFIIVASLGGAPKHPAWYKNLVVHPEAEVQVGTAHHKVRARDAQGEERRRLFDLMIGIMPGYADYERRTAGIREIPIVVLEPR